MISKKFTRKEISQIYGIKNKELTSFIQDNIRTKKIIRVMAYTEPHLSKKRVAMYCFIPSNKDLF